MTTFIIIAFVVLVLGVFPWWLTGKFQSYLDKLENSAREIRKKDAEEYRAMIESRR